jgi:hypothetical protein
MKTKFISEHQSGPSLLKVFWAEKPLAHETHAQVQMTLSEYRIYLPGDLVPMHSIFHEILHCGFFRWACGDALEEVINSIVFTTEEVVAALLRAGWTWAPKKGDCFVFNTDVPVCLQAPPNWADDAEEKLAVENKDPKAPEFRTGLYLMDVNNPPTTETFFGLAIVWDKLHLTMADTSEWLREAEDSSVLFWIDSAKSSAGFIANAIDEAMRRLGEFTTAYESKPLAERDRLGGDVRVYYNCAREFLLANQERHDQRSGWWTKRQLPEQ